MAKKSAHRKKAYNASESIVIQVGVAVVVVAGFALLMYAIKMFL